MAKKPKESDNKNTTTTTTNKVNGNGVSTPVSNSSNIFKTLFGDAGEQQQQSSSSIFSDYNPFRRKPTDPFQPTQLGLGFGSAEDDYETPSIVEVKKRKRRVEKPSLDIKKSKRDEQETYDFGVGKFTELGFDLEESSKRGKGEKHQLGHELKEALEIDKGEDPNLRLKSEEGKDDDMGMELNGTVSMEKKAKKKKKRKRDEIEAEYEARQYGAVVSNDEGGEGGLGGKVKVVGKKRKKADDPVDMMVSKEGFDDEAKLLRTVFVGNLPLKVKKKALFKEFSQFGEIESVRIRSIPLMDTKIPRKGAIIQKKINDAVDSVHAYIVFKTEEGVQASLAHNMAVVGGNHIRVDRACPPCKKLKGENTPLYDDKRTVFVGNLPFDVKDEEVYQLFFGIKDLESSIEAIRVIRDSGTSVGKGIAYVLFKTRGAANLVVKKHSLKLRDRELRLSHTRSSLTPSKRKYPLPGERNDSPTKRLSVDLRNPDSSNKVKAKPDSSYQGMRASKSGVRKKFHPKVIEPMNFKSRSPKGGEKSNEWTEKRPAVAARKASALNGGGSGGGDGASKQAGEKRKVESRTPESSRPNKKTRKFR